MSELTDINVIRSNKESKCFHRFSCPLSSGCKKENPEDECYTNLWKDIKASRIIIQDMTERMALAMSLADRIYNELNL